MRLMISGARAARHLLLQDVVLDRRSRRGRRTRAASGRRPSRRRRAGAARRAGSATSSASDRVLAPRSGRARWPRSQPRSSARKASSAAEKVRSTRDYLAGRRAAGQTVRLSDRERTRLHTRSPAMVDCAHDRLGGGVGMRQVSVLVLAVLLAATSARAQGTITDSPVTFTIPASHLRHHAAGDLTASRPRWRRTRLFESGWWYRVEGIAAEHSLRPEWQSYVGELARRLDQRDTQGVLSARESCQVNNVGRWHRARWRIR